MLYNSILAASPNISPAARKPKHNLPQNPTLACLLAISHLRR